MSSLNRSEQILQHLTPTSNQSRLLQGQVAIVTGAGQGIGRATAVLFAQNGADVVISDIDAKAAHETAEEIIQAGARCICVIGDITDPKMPEQIVSTSLEKFGKINILVNNAGFCIDSAIHKMNDKVFETIMKIHNTVPFRMTKALSSSWMNPENKNMPKAIINVSSTSGLHGSMGQINYSTAKMGVVGMTKTIAAEWGRYNVRCNAVAYGWIDTRITRPPDTSLSFSVDGAKVTPGIPLNAKKWRDLSSIPLGRVGTTEDAAGCMLFLASPLAAYVTGTVLECTGGRFM